MFEEISAMGFESAYKMCVMVGQELQFETAWINRNSNGLVSCFVFSPSETENKMAFSCILEHFVSPRIGPRF
jgi:hypothetical protein